MFTTTCISVFFITSVLSVSYCDIFNPTTEWIPTTFFNNDVVKSIKSGVQQIPNVFGVAEYLPEIGQQKIAVAAVKNLIEATLSSPGIIVTNEIDLPNVDKNFPKWGTLSLKDGKLEGLHSLVHTPLETSLTPDGKVEIKSQLHFKNLVVSYGSVSVSPLDIRSVECGSMRMKFTFNTVEVQVLVVKYYDVIDKLVKSDCACVLTALEVKDLGGVRVQFQNRSIIHISLAPKGMAYLEGAVTEKVNYAVVKIAFKRLKESDSWICRDHRLKETIQNLDQKMSL